MLNDGGGSFHLSNDIEKGGFVKRTKDLLFAFRDIYEPSSIYFLDIYSHGEWSKKRILEIIYKNWGEKIEKFRLKGVISVSHEPNNEGLSILRNSSISTAIKLDDDSVYNLLGGGMVLNGVNLNSIRFCAKAAERLKNCGKYLLEK